MLRKFQYITPYYYIWRWFWFPFKWDFASEQGDEKKKKIPDLLQSRLTGKESVVDLTALSFNLNSIIFQIKGRSRIVGKLLALSEYHFYRG